jgi:glutamine synthetase
MLDNRWPLLPHGLPEAVEAFRSSVAAAESFGPAFVEHLAHVKQDEWKDFTEAVQEPNRDLNSGPVTEWELNRYFNHA